MITDTNYSNKCNALQDAIKSKTIAFHKRLKELYPCVEDVTKLPHAWIPHTRATTIGLTHDNLGCYFRGRRVEEEKSAASARTDNFIPPSCLLYYFEIKFISQGREGYMGVGLSSPSCSLEKLPGLERDSYAYHADDGNIFDGNPRGLKYAEKSKTGDIVGCGYNLVEGKIFFTQNGYNLGKAFEDVPSNMLFYPTIGLRAHGEEISANFGQDKFVYDIEQDMRSLRKNMTLAISNYPISNFATWQHTLHKLVQSWLLQNSYPETAAVFSKSTKLDCQDNMQRVQQRKRIQQLVMNGRISEAIKLTNTLCPNLFLENPNLLFMLKCRQFIELIGGSENDFQLNFNFGSGEDEMIGLENKDIQENCNHIKTSLGTNGDQPESSLDRRQDNMPSNLPNENNIIRSSPATSRCNGMMCDNNCEKTNNHSTSSHQESMEVDQPASISIQNPSNNHHRSSPNDKSSSDQTRLTNNDRLSSTLDQKISNGTNHPNNDRVNTVADVMDVPLTDEELDRNVNRFEKLIQFGQRLCQYLDLLNKTFGKDESNEKLLQDTIGLIAYINPQNNNKICKLLDPKEREPLSQMLNTTILSAETDESNKPHLEEVVNHLRTLVRLNNSLGHWLVDDLYRVD